MGNLIIKNFCLCALLKGNFLFSDVSIKKPSKQFFTDHKDLIVIDIRPEEEVWANGKVYCAKNIPLYDDMGNMILKEFIEELKNTVGDNKEIAIMCGSGYRSIKISELLSEKFNYNVINLKGGLNNAIKEGVKIIEVD
jgi:rhodanese-related sulfurtransferase